jgi:rfaE bifunctional protein nucleotidyltransferase chain/domain
VDGGWWLVKPLKPTSHEPRAASHAVSGVAFEAKICRPQDLGARLKTVKRPLVFTNGVFDILHRGHVAYLARARALGASLVVALNSDASARKLAKGEDRPVNALEDRAALVAALESVSLVTWFEQETPLELINQLKPDVLVKGGDWKVDAIVGAKEVKGWGGSGSQDRCKALTQSDNNN